LIWALLAASWDLLSGYAGQVSFGHAGFFVLGGYTAAITSKSLGLSAWLGVGLGALLAAAVGLAVGFPALRLRGHYLALTTFGFADVWRRGRQTGRAPPGGLLGISGSGTFSPLPADPLLRRQAIYVVVLLFVVVSLAVMAVICERTPAGKAFRAIR